VDLASPSPYAVCARWRELFWDGGTGWRGEFGNASWESEEIPEFVDRTGDGPVSTGDETFEIAGCFRDGAAEDVAGSMDESAN